MNPKVRYALAILLAVLLLVFFFRNSDPSRIWMHLRSMSPGWFAIGLLSNVCALLCRVERWRTVLSHETKPAFYPTFFATTLGFMSSAILPVRAGEVIRPALLSRRTGFRFSTALGTVVIEKLLDLIAVMGLFALFVFTTGRHFAADPRYAARFVVISGIGSIAAAAVAFLLGFLFAVYFFHLPMRKVHGAVARILPKRVRPSWMRVFDSFVKSLALVRSPAKGLKVLALTCAVWFFLCSQFVFVARAVHHPLPYSASFFVTGMAILGLMVPTPGGIGGFHKACQIALTGFYGFDVDSSIALAVIFHAVGTLPVIVIGATLAMREGLGVKQLVNIGENGDR